MKKISKNFQLLFIFSTLIILPIIGVVSCNSQNTETISENMKKVTKDKAQFTDFSQNVLTESPMLELGQINNSVINSIDSRNRPPQLTSGVTRTFEVVKHFPSRGKINIKITFKAGKVIDTFTYSIKGFAKVLSEEEQKISEDKAKFTNFSQHVLSGSSMFELGQINNSIINSINGRSRPPQLTPGVTRTFEVVKHFPSRGKINIKITFKAGKVIDTFTYPIRGFLKTE